MAMDPLGRTASSSPIERESDLWWERLSAWTSEALESAGSRITGEFSVVRRTPWRIEAAVETGLGPVRVVETVPSHQFEGALLAALTRHAAPVAPRVLAVDRGACRFMVHDDAVPLASPPQRRGRRAAVRPDDPAVRELLAAVTAFLPAWAEAQRGLAAHRTDLRMCGTPAMDPAWFPAFTENQLASHAERPESHPLHLAEEEAEELSRRLRPAVQDAAKTLMGSDLPLMLDPVVLVTHGPAAGDLAWRDEAEADDAGDGAGDGERDSARNGGRHVVVTRLADASLTHPFSLVRTVLEACAWLPQEADEPLAAALSDWISRVSRTGDVHGALPTVDAALRVAPLAEYSALLRLSASPQADPEDPNVRQAGARALDCLRSVGTVPPGWERIRSLL